MKPWIKRTLYGLFGATLVIGGLSACGHRHEGHGMNMSAEDHAKFRDKMVDRMASKLDLTADQKARAATLADKLHEQRMALVGTTTNPRAEVQALVAGAKFDKARAQALITEKTAALNAKSPEVVAAMADFFEGRHGWWGRV
jgi:periplasmic protein CpxP/Spy